MKLFLDDIREPYDDTWRVVRNFSEFKKAIETYKVPEIVSFDHDLAFEHYPVNEAGIILPAAMVATNPTGLDCAKYLLEFCKSNYMDYPKVVLVHSWNSDGAVRIADVFRPYTSVVVAPYHNA